MLFYGTAAGVSGEADVSISELVVGRLLMMGERCMAGAV